MTFRETQLVAYAAGSLVHAALVILVLNLYRHTSGYDRVEAWERIAVCLAGFFWQFGNLWQQAALYRPIWGNMMWYSALMTFPVLFANSLREPTPYSRAATLLTKAGRFLRYPQWILTLVSIFAGFQVLFGKTPLIDPDLAIRLALRIMLFFFALFTVIGVIRRRKAPQTHDGPSRRARRLRTTLAPVTAVMFIILLDFSNILQENAKWLNLAAGMMSIPPTIGTAFRLYRFPFMDIFLRETLTGLTLLAAFCIGLNFGPQDRWWPLWIATVAMGIAVARAPLSRLVERKFLGYNESAEEQDERVGSAIRNVTNLDGFDEAAAQVLQKEVDADWATISTEQAAGAAATFQIPDSPPLTLSLGPRKHGNTYMSRQLRLLRTSVLQIAAQRQRLKREDSERKNLVEQHELREITSRAQMKALQAQINPHFLFNTLNTLAALIDSNPEKAEHVTENLADVFRYALDSTRLDRITLDEELKFLESYLAIEKARFDSRLSYSFDVDPVALQLSIPPMILQPLVENAVRHGIGQKLEGGSVRVIARVDGDYLTLYVEDTGVGFVRERPGGVGLTNTRDRLKHAYGDAAEFRIEAIMPEGTRMVIRLKI